MRGLVGPWPALLGAGGPLTLTTLLLDGDRAGVLGVALPLLNQLEVPLKCGLSRDLENGATTDIYTQHIGQALKDI